MRPTPNGLLSFVCALALAACGQDPDPDVEARPGDAGAEPAEPVLVITDKDNEVDLVLTKASVYMMLSEDLRTKVDEELDRELGEQESSDFAQGFKEWVIGGVEKMLRHRIEYAVDDIRGVTYEGGELVFDIEDEGILSFDDVEMDDGKNVLANFREDDARRFVAAFEELKRR